MSGMLIVEDAPAIASFIENGSARTATRRRSPATVRQR
jgi:hypothetical protein